MKNQIDKFFEVKNMFNFLKHHKEIFLIGFAFFNFCSIAVANVALALAVMTFLWLCHEEGLQLEEEYKPYFYVVGLFFAMLLLSALASESVEGNLKLWIENWAWRFMLFVIPVFSLKRAEQVQKVVYAAIAGIVLSDLYLFYQYFYLNADRPNGFYGHYMRMAGMFCEMLPVFVVILLSEMISTKQKIALALVTVLSIGGMLANGSRGASLACALSVLVVLFVLFLKKYKKQALVGMLCLACLAGVFFTNVKFSERAISVTNISTDASNVARLYMWRGAVAMFHDNPLLGVGEGQYRTSVESKYLVPEQVVVFNHAHSIFFHELAVHGALGCGAMVIMFGSILWWNLKCFLKTNSFWALAAFASTLSLLIQGITEYNIGTSAVMKHYWLLLGCLVVLARLEGRGENNG